MTRRSDTSPRGKHTSGTCTKTGTQWHGGLGVTLGPDMWPVHTPGNEFLRIEVANRRGPVYQSDRSSFYEFQGPGSQCEAKPSHAPPADSPWPRRHLKRDNAIKHVKKSKDYVEMLLQESTRQRAELDRPPTPDPTDRSKSKRQWEASVEAWIYSIRAIEVHC